MTDRCEPPSEGQMFEDGRMPAKPMTDRCEPPPELRGVDGWHWLGAHCPVFWIAEEQEWDWTEDEHVAPDAAYRYGYRYLSPVATPAEVEALRAERDEALKLQGEVHRLRTGIKLLADTVRAWGWQSKAQESNGELVGRALHEMDAANRALGTSRNTLRARVAELEGALGAVLPYAEDAQDAGPHDEGWQSAKLIAALDAARAALSPATES